MQNNSFNSRPHKEVDADGVIQTLPVLSFQFTTSQGGRLYGSTALDDIWQLSIHDLTRRSTQSVLIRADWSFLSIHDLTRRSTDKTPVRVPELSFQFTTSQGGRPGERLQPIFELTFNSRPHKEVDHSIRIHKILKMPFNSRPHKEVDVALFNRVKLGEIFQFTTSQGGRR